jgi:hypothetical protein
MPESPTQQLLTGDLRRRLRAPFRACAKLEIVGITPRGAKLPVVTIDANQWGVRIESDEPLSAGAKVRIHVIEPGGVSLALSGSMVYAQHSPIGSWQGGIEFDFLQPLLAVNRLDSFSYGS